MLGRTNTGGGGGGLNFQVIGGATAPSNPKENTIWVNTDVKITTWAFSATEPEAPVEGMVWITTGTSSSAEFNTLKKNGIQVYPLSAKQYVGGSWVDVEAKSYQGGEWVDLVTDLLTTLDEFEILAAAQSVYSMQDGTLHISYSSANGDASDIVMTRKKILDTRGRSKLSVIAHFNTLTYANAGIYPMFGLVANKPTSATKPSFVASVNVTQTTNGKTEYELNLDGCQGEYYFVIYSAASRGNVYDIGMS